MQDLMDIQRNLNPVDPDKPVLVAGDPERERIKECGDLGGIPYPRNVVDYMVRSYSLSQFLFVIFLLQHCTCCCSFISVLLN